jgi:hypothetical protein
VTKEWHARKNEQAVEKSGPAAESAGLLRLHVSGSTRLLLMPRSPT